MALNQYSPPLPRRPTARVTRAVVEMCVSACLCLCVCVCACCIVAAWPAFMERMHGRGVGGVEYRARAAAVSTNKETHKGARRRDTHTHTPEGCCAFAHSSPSPLLTSTTTNSTNTNSTVSAKTGSHGRDTGRRACRVAAAPLESSLLGPLSPASKEKRRPPSLSQQQHACQRTSP